MPRPLYETAEQREANANWKLDDTLIFNSSTVTRTGGTPQTAINQDHLEVFEDLIVYLEQIQMRLIIF